jgi:uncharacterized protein YegL
MSLMRSLVVVFRVCLLLAVAAGPAVAQRGDLQVEIQNIPEQLFLTRDEREIDVAGRASIFGGMKQLDLFLILDASNSLWRTDPKDHRVQAAEALIRALPASSDMRVGVIAFDTDAFMIAPLSEDREVVLEELPGLRRDGGTNLHDGIRMALESFAEAGRPEAAHIALLFTDGKSDKKKAILAAEEARSRGAVIHSVLLLDRDKSENLLRTIAGTTGGSFVYVDDPEELPRAFLDLRTTGVEHVKLSVDGGALIDTDLVAGSFRGNVPLRPGHNDIDRVRDRGPDPGLDLQRADRGPAPLVPSARRGERRASREGLPSDPDHTRRRQLQGRRASDPAREPHHGHRHEHRRTHRRDLGRRRRPAPRVQRADRLSGTRRAGGDLARRPRRRGDLRCVGQHVGQDEPRAQDHDRQGDRPLF